MKSNSFVSASTPPVPSHLGHGWSPIVNEPVLTSIPMISHGKQNQQLNLTQAIWVCVSKSISFMETCFRYDFNLCFVTFFTLKHPFVNSARKSSRGQVMPTSRWLRLCLVQYLDPPWDDDPFYGFFVSKTTRVICWPFLKLFHRSP